MAFGFVVPLNGSSTAELPVQPEQRSRVLQKLDAGIHMAGGGHNLFATMGNRNIYRNALAVPIPDQRTAEAVAVR